MHHEACQRCLKSSVLHCCHIFGRRHYSTRFDPNNAIVLCYACHKWFDSHKIQSLLFDENKRVLGPEDESYTFLVKIIGYEWHELLALYLKSQESFRGYKNKKQEITKNLKKLIMEKL